LQEAIYIQASLFEDVTEGRAFDGAMGGDGDLKKLFADSFL
jgi:hypothetical protein